MNNNMDNNINNKTFETYQKICANLSEQYDKCISEKKTNKAFECDGKLYLLQKICMRPSGVSLAYK